MKEQMDRLKSMNQNKKINVEDSVGPDAIRSEVTVGDLLVLKMFHQSSLLNGICIYVKKISKGDKDEQRTTILEDPMIFAADDVPFMIGAFEKMLARKRLWRQAKAAGWTSPKMEQYISELEGVPPNTKMEEIVKFYGKPSEIPTHATRTKVFPISAYLSYSSIYMPVGWAHFVLQRIMYPWRRPSITISSDMKLKKGGDGYKDIKNPSAEQKDQWLFCGGKEENYVKIPMEELEGFLFGLQNLAAQQLAKIAFSFGNHEIPMYMFLNLLWEGVASLAHGHDDTVLELKNRFHMFSLHQVRRIGSD